MTSPGLFFWQDKIGKTNPRCVPFAFKITAAKTISQLPQGTPVLTTFDALASQSVIDDFLGTSSEFLLAQFDATSMGVNAFGIIVNMLKQVDELFYIEAYVDDGAGTHTDLAVSAVTTLTSSSLTTQCATGSQGNVAARIIVAGLDALTSGMIVVKFYFKSK